MAKNARPSIPKVDCWLLKGLSGEEVESNPSTPEITDPEPPKTDCVSVGVGV